MGSNTDPRRGRARNRGLASFVSFLLLFAFALGQGSSLMALAEGAGTDPVATEDVASDGASGDAASPASEAPAEEAPAVEEGSGDAETSADAGAAATSSGGAGTGKLNTSRVGGPRTSSAPAVVEETAIDTPGPASGDGVQPVVVPSNPDCDDVLPGQYLFAHKTGVPHDDTIPLSFMGQTGTLVIDVHGNSTFDFTFTGDFVAIGVIVKGGPNANFYDYSPDGDDADTALHAPVNPQNDKFYGLSHIEFCIGERVFHPAIDIEKTCPEAVPFGDDITYSITLENTGDEDLENIVVTDTVNGNAPVDISDLFADTLAPGESDTAQFVYTPDGSEPDPLPNEATVTADGVSSGDSVSDTDGCETDITHQPDIDVTKECPAEVPFGEDIDYTITVTNTGNEPLVGVTVTDTLLGDITGDFDVDFSNPFPVGATATANVSYSPGADEDPVTNTVTASGTGEDSGVEASAEASCETDVLNPNPEIDVDKTCTSLAHVGDTVTYSITVTNTGDEDLDGVTVSDTILGDLSASFADSLGVGASESHQFDHVVQADDPDPLVNEVTATGTGTESETVVDDTALCQTDVIHPAIEIVKTVSEEIVAIGDTVTYTYVVTNTGDTTLYDISVDDDILGHIGDIDVLEPGQSVTLTRDFVVGDEPVTNVATATGEDILGRSVSADDDATVSPIAGENPPETPPDTPFTGSDAGRLGLIAMVLFGIGVTVVATTRRRRPERGSA
jgi:uncharacterized repeat protein (TIGR01451 family)